MNIPLRIILAAMLVFVFSSTGFAGEKAKLGPCVKACVHAYNPSLADSGADEFMADDFYMGCFPLYSLISCFLVIGMVNTLQFVDLRIKPFCVLLHSTF
jgi:hypothetical protein